MFVFTEASSTSSVDDEGMSFDDHESSPNVEDNDLVSFTTIAFLLSPLNHLLACKCRSPIMVHQALFLKQRNAALFIMKTRDGKRITQSCLDGILSDVSVLYKHNLECVSSRAVEVLKGLGATNEMLCAVKSSILSETSQAPFKGMETEALQNSLFRSEFGLVVSAHVCKLTIKMFITLHFFQEPVESSRKGICAEWSKDCSEEQLLL